MIVVDPRFTRSAAKADEYVRIRSGTDIAFLVRNAVPTSSRTAGKTRSTSTTASTGWTSQGRCDGQWTPDKVEEVCRVRRRTVYKMAQMMAKNRPSTIVWCMGQTQHTIGNAIVRASCILQLALGNIGVSGGGANIFRGHDNVQGATDVGPNPDSLPGYYGLATGSWKYWAGVWAWDYEWIKKQYADGMMEKSGTTVSRWIDAVMYPNDRDRPGPKRESDGVLGACAEQPDARQGHDRSDEKSSTSWSSSIPIRPQPPRCALWCGKDGVYLLPAATQFETSGSVTRRIVRCNGARR
jgi:formate dehydrogenase major subunit